MPRRRLLGLLPPRLGPLPRLAPPRSAQVATLLLALHNLVGRRGPPGFVPAIKAAFALTFMYTRFWVSDPSLTSQTLHRLLRHFLVGP